MNLNGTLLPHRIAGSARDTSRCLVQSSGRAPEISEGVARLLLVTSAQFRTSRPTGPTTASFVVGIVMVLSAVDCRQLLTRSRLSIARQQSEQDIEDRIQNIPQGISLRPATLGPRGKVALHACPFSLDEAARIVRAQRLQSTGLCHDAALCNTLSDQCPHSARDAGRQSRQMSVHRPGSVGKASPICQLLP